MDPPAAQLVITEAASAGLGGAVGQAAEVAPAFAPARDVLPAPASPAAIAPAARPAFLSTGVPRIDHLLGGGYAAGTATLLYGPPFCGKQVLQQLAFVSAACRGIPSTFILHGVGAEAMSEKLRRLDPRFAAAEHAGFVTYIDAHSHFLGEPTGHPNTVYVEDPQDIQRILQALERRGSDGAGPVPGLVAVQSASTLLMDLGPQRAFHFLRAVLGRTLKAGGVGLLALQAGMHTDSEVQMAKHLCAGMLEMRKKGECQVLHIEGLETSVVRPGWIEYEFTPRAFRLTGSFSSKTIR